MDKRLAQGWGKEKITDLQQCIARIKEARKNKDVTSIAYLGNIVDLWEALAEEAKEGEMLADLGSDQTSLHNPFNGGYYPVQLSFAESQRMMVEDPKQFKSLVQESLLRHMAAVQLLADKGMYFWDYGNALYADPPCARSVTLLLFAHASTHTLSHSLTLSLTHSLSPTHSCTILLHLARSLPLDSS